MQTDAAAFGHLGDAVDDGVFDERLKKERREETLASVVLDLLFEMEAIAEANFFDGAIFVEEVKFGLQRDKGFFAEAESHAEEVGEEDAHIASTDGIDAGESADGIERIVEEVRIDLGFEGAEFGIAGAETGFKSAGLGFAGGGLGDEGVVEGDAEEIEEDASGVEQTGFVLIQLGNAAPGFVSIEFGGDDGADLDPEKGEQDSGGNVSGEKAPQGRAGERCNAAGNKTGLGADLSDAGEDGGEKEGVLPGNFAGRGEESREDESKENPAGPKHDVFGLDGRRSFGDGAQFLTTMPPKSARPRRIRVFLGAPETSGVGWRVSSL